MQFTVLSHAGLLVEHGGVRVVCDPWLIGSCYWRSWWNFPEPPEELLDDFHADVVYLTHLHWDHFHGPSLRRFFAPDTPILVPKVATRRMVDDLRFLGFRNVIEIPHGRAHRLGPDFHLHSYQFGIGVDSAAVLTAPGTTLFNCNDAKFFGLPLAEITRNHPRIDFIFRSHSSAGPIPWCVEDHARLLPEVVAQTDSAEQFARCALHVGARYAIPFASNHCFLHRETVEFNRTATTPEDVRRVYQRLAGECAVQSECVVMPPGSGWSESAGFELRPFDFTARADYIEMLLERHAGKLDACYRAEAEVAADFPAFAAYFEALLRSIPALLRRTLPAVVFRTRDRGGTHHWLVDPSRRRVATLGEPPTGCVVFEVHAAVLRDCVRERMFSVWSASKRLRIHLPTAASLGAATRWLTLLDLYELEMLPLARNFTARALGVRLRRWREPLELSRLLVRRVFGGSPLALSALYPLKVG
jgi:UDP-MurNAc hydroxylase